MNRGGSVTGLSTQPATGLITAASGTGITLNAAGQIQRTTYKVTVTSAAYAAGGASLTADVTIGTLPAKTKLNAVVADLTVPFTGGAVSAAALTAGKAAGTNEYLLSFDCFTAAVTKGLANGDLGASLATTATTPVQGGDVASWSAVQILSTRITTVTANVSALTAGSITFYITAETMP